MRLHAIPGALLLILAGSQYGEAALAAVTGWPVDWCYALLQAAGQAALWAVVAASAPLQALRVLGAARPAVPPCPADTSIAALGPPQCRVGPWDIPPR